MREDSNKIKYNKIKRKITTDNTEVQRIIRDCFEQLYTNKLDNLEKTDKLLETYHLSGLNHEEIENLNKPITVKEIDSVIRTSPLPSCKNSSGPDGW